MGIAKLVWVMAITLCSQSVIGQTFTPAGPDPRDGPTRPYVEPQPTQVVIRVDQMTRVPADEDAASEIAALETKLDHATTESERAEILGQIEKTLNRGICTIVGQAAVLGDGRGQWDDRSPTPDYYANATLEISSGHSRKVAALQVGDFVLIPRAAQATTFWRPEVFNEIGQPAWWVNESQSSNQPAQSPPAVVEPTQSRGSGFFVTTDGHFITNFHVIEAARRITIRTSKGTHRATIVREDPSNDLAVLKVVGEFPALAVHGSTELKLAERVCTVGFPNPDLQGLAAKYTEGTVAALSGIADDPRFLQISVPVQPGNSGGPLVDSSSSGRVVGVVVAQLDKIATLELTGNLPENVNYAIKGTLLLAVLEAVPGWKQTQEKVTAIFPDQTAVAAHIEQACGLVLVER